MKKAIVTTSYRTALGLAIAVSLSMGISGCSSDESKSDEVKAVDRVDDASEQARANAPEPEDQGFAETTPVPTAETANMDEAVNVTDNSVEAESAAVDTAETEAISANTGVQIYEQKCKMCHDSGLLNAPIYGDKASWEPRLGKGLDTLTMHSAEGFNQMPAQAFGGTTEAEVRAAVEYMVDAVS